jgi:hypothetical protein
MAGDSVGLKSLPETGRPLDIPIGALFIDEL